MSGVSVDRSALQGFRPGVEFKNEKLYIFSRYRILVASGWPHMRAWTRTTRTAWVATRSYADQQICGRLGELKAAPLENLVLDSDLIHRFGLQVAMQLVGRRAWDIFKEAQQHVALRAYFAHFPQDLLRAVEQFPQRRWQLLAMAARCDGAGDLIRSNPALAVALSNCWVFRPEAKRDAMRCIRRLVRAPQREIAYWLGFDADRSTARILAKVTAQAASIERLFYLRQALKDPSTKKRLAHAPLLTWQVLRLLCDNTVAPHLSATFYRDPAILEAGVDDWGDLVHLIRAAAANDCHCDKSAGRHQIRTVEELLRRAVETTCRTGVTGPNLLRFNVPEATCRAPSGAADQILSIQGLIDEGREMRHCIGGLHYWRCLVDGSIRVYRIHAPFRATAMLTRQDSGWQLSAMRGLADVQFGPEAHRIVSGWFSADGHPNSPTLIAACPVARLR